MENRISNNLRKVLVYGFAYTVSFAVLAIVMLNAAELFFSVDVPYARSLKPFEHEVVVQDLIADFGAVGINEEAVLGQQYVRPEFMRVYRNNIRMAIDEEYYVQDSRWVRPLSAHYASLNVDSNGNPGDTLIYMNESWRTIPDTTILTTGTNIMVESVGGGAIDYTVVENFTLNDTERYIPESSTSRQLILLVSRDDGTYSIIRAISFTPKED